MDIVKVIAIDGPSGSGKSSIASLLSDKMHFLHINTGAMFRAIAYACDKNNILMEEGDNLNHFLLNLDLQYGESEDCLISVNGENLSLIIKEHRISRLASVVAKLPSVRNFLLDFQRSIVTDKICVMEGRDIGTVIFPGAFAKFFITASVEERAKRRLLQLQKDGDTHVNLEQLINDQKRRDESDMKREVAPLVQADDAELVDTTTMSISEVIEFLSKSISKKAKKYGLSL